MNFKSDLKLVWLSVLLAAAQAVNLQKSFQYIKLVAAVD